MPTYEYECTRCGITIEEFKPMSAPRRKRCPKCRGKVQRLISGGMGIHFKGSGFYVTDSRSKMSRSDGSDSSGSGDSSAAKSDSKSDSKTSKPSKKSD